MIISQTVELLLKLLAATIALEEADSRVISGIDSEPLNVLAHKHQAAHNAYVSLIIQASTPSNEVRGLLAVYNSVFAHRV